MNNKQLLYLTLLIISIIFFIEIILLNLYYQKDDNKNICEQFIQNKENSVKEEIIYPQETLKITLENGSTYNYKKVEYKICFLLPKKY